MTAAVLEARDLTRRFGDLTALDSVSFSIPPGQVVGLLGHNGAGKTTTIRVLNGLLAPSEGAVRALGMEPLERGPEVRARTGVLTETPSLDDRMTAREAMRFWAELWNVRPEGVAARVDELLEQFELGSRADDRIGGYSRGMRQRLALARTLLHDPPLLFLDEPTAALDPIASLAVRDMVRSLAAAHERTILLCTHNLAEAQELCDRVIILRRGRIVADGTPAEVARLAALRVGLELEVDGEHLATALRVAGEGGAAVTQRGDGRLRVEGIARDDVPALVARLVQAEVSVYRVTPEEPTLEQAYVALYEEAGP
ncbi:MAG TPA: ABC transporter ATP-binding protein [Candidatus Angelobacter sp.]|nr:ABC transporter ATP-binding protein [Candidatus Angelobacter sp.]